MQTDRQRKSDRHTGRVGGDGRDREENGKVVRSSRQRSRGRKGGRS